MDHKTAVHTRLTRSKSRQTKTVSWHQLNPLVAQKIRPVRPNLKLLGFKPQRITTSS